MQNIQKFFHQIRAKIYGGPSEPASDAFIQIMSFHLGCFENLHAPRVIHEVLCRFVTRCQSQSFIMWQIWVNINLKRGHDEAYLSKRQIMKYILFISACYAFIIDYVPTVVWINWWMYEWITPICIDQCHSRYVLCKAVNTGVTLVVEIWRSGRWTAKGHC